MLFNQKIYLNNKPLVLTNSAEKYMLRNPVSADYLFLKGASVQNFRLAQKHLEQASNIGVVIADDVVENFLITQKTVFRPIEAGGGVVSNEDNDILMILRDGKWDLPKGKMDEGESISDCAKREVSEETGLGHIILGKEIITTYHVYTRDDNQFLKASHWFQMRASKNELLRPQKEENIAVVKWIPEKELGTYAASSYETIKEVLKAAGRLNS